MTPHVECLVTSQNLIGENPLWHVGEQALYWLDTRTPIVRRYAPATAVLDEWRLPAPLDSTDQIVSFGFRRRGGLLAALRRGFHVIDLPAGTHTPIVDAEVPPAVPVANRMNDGKCDIRGRYWCGSIDTGYTAPTGALYRLDPDHRCTRVDHGAICSNGLAFSPDYRRLYYADTRAFVVWVFDVDIDDGALSNKREFVSTRAFAGRPDGATVDTNGCYWIAMIGMGAVARFSPQGQLLRLIDLPVSHPTMCMFGGSRMDTLFVTSASGPLDETARRHQPLAGALFAITGTGAQGWPEPFFEG